MEDVRGPALAGAGYAAKPTSRLPPELALQGVAGHLDRLADVVALADALAPNLRRTANIWDSEAYRRLQPQSATSPALAPPASYGAQVRRRVTAQSVAYDVDTSWSRERCGAALAGPYLATAYHVAKLACPDHRLFAANAERTQNLRQWLGILDALGAFVLGAAQSATTDADRLRRGAYLAAWRDRAFHAVALATLLLPEPAQDPALGALRCTLDAAAGPLRSP